MKRPSITRLIQAVLPGSRDNPGVRVNRPRSRVTDDDLDIAAEYIAKLLTAITEDYDPVPVFPQSPRAVTEDREPTPVFPQPPRTAPVTRDTGYRCFLCRRPITTTQQITQATISRAWVHTVCWDNR